MPSYSTGGVKKPKIGEFHDMLNTSNFLQLESFSIYHLFYLTPATNQRRKYYNCKEFLLREIWEIWVWGTTQLNDFMKRQTVYRAQNKYKANDAVKIV